MSPTHVLFTSRSCNKIFGTRVCYLVSLHPFVRIYSWKSLRFSSLFDEHQYACVFWKWGEEKCTQNFSPETSSKEITLDTQAYIQRYVLSANEHRDWNCLFPTAQTSWEIVAWLSDYIFSRIMLHEINMRSTLKVALKLLSSDTVVLPTFDKMATCCGQFVQQIHKIPLVFNAEGFTRSQQVQ